LSPAEIQLWIGAVSATDLSSSVASFHWDGQWSVVTSHRFPV